MLDAHLLRASWRSWLSDDHGRVGPYWLQLLWTLLFCLTVALGFTVLGFLNFERGSGAWRSASAWAHWYPINLVVSLVIGFLIHGLYELGNALIGRARLRRWSGARRTVYYAGVPLLGVVIGWPLGAWLVSGRSGVRLVAGNAELVTSMMGISLLLTLLMYLWFESRAQQVQAERCLTEARLQLLQAQIEPHFLFNTLAHVESLIEPDPPRARRMLEHFSDYLRASLGELRSERSTVGAELDMARAYLDLMQLRMADRLHFSIEADEAVRAQPVPPLLLQPLIENAVTHGLEPQLEGGRLSVRARLIEGQVLIEVEDDGVGLAAAGAAPPRRAGQGLALENLRQRLASRHGSTASLRLEPLTRGTRATLHLPTEEAA